MSTAVLSHAPSADLPLAGLRTSAPAAPAIRPNEMALAAGCATTLKTAARHVLEVRQGRIWITLTATAQHASEDLVLAAGERLSVPAGESLVVEPWSAEGATFHWTAA